MTVWIQRFPLNPAVFFFFCFHPFQGGMRQILLFMRQMSQFTHCSDTVYTLFIGPTTTLFKKIFKIDPTILFTHLKIILLQYFQFSATISSIQTDSMIIIRLVNEIVCGNVIANNGEI